MIKFFSLYCTLIIFHLRVPPAERVAPPAERILLPPAERMPALLLLERIVVLLLRIVLPEERVTVPLERVVVFTEREGETVVVVVVPRVVVPREICVVEVRVGVAEVVRVTLVLLRVTVPLTAVAPPRTVALVERFMVVLPLRVRTFVLPKVVLRVLCGETRVCPTRPASIPLRDDWRTIDWRLRSKVRALLPRKDALRVANERSGCRTA